MAKGQKRTASQAGLPEDVDVSNPQGTKRAGLEITGVEPDARRQGIAEGTTSTTRNDADSDIQVTEVSTSSDDSLGGSSSIASVCLKREKHVRRDRMFDAFRSDCVDIDEKEAQEISALLLEIVTVTRDCENHQGIVASQCEKLGLRPGFAVDLNALKPWNGIAWNVCNPKGGDELMDFLNKEDPELVIGSSSCDVSDFLKGSSRAMENQTDFHVCARLCKTTPQGQDLSARSTHPIHHVEEQGHLMDRIISWSIQGQRSNLSVDSLQSRFESCWFCSTCNLLDDE